MTSFPYFRPFGHRSIVSIPSDEHGTRHTTDTQQLLVGHMTTVEKAENRTQGKHI